MGVKLTRHGVGTWSWVCVHLYVMKIIASLDLVLIKLTSWFLLYLSSLNSIFLKIGISLLMYLAALDLSCCMQTLSYGMGDLIPWLGIEPGPPTLGVQSPKHWTTREVPIFFFIHFSRPEYPLWAHSKQREFSGLVFLKNNAHENDCRNINLFSQSLSGYT